MADEGNGGYMNYGDGESDFKRKADQNQKTEHHQESDNEEDREGSDRKISKPINEYYIKELLSERVHIDGKYAHADRLLEQEIQIAKQNGRLPGLGKDTRYVDIYLEKPTKVVVKVTVPVKEHPRFNFVGKLLGPKGNSLRRLQEETMCKMAVMGRGSMKDRAKEESLRQGLDPKYSHLNDELHVEISALAPPAEAHARVAFALAELRKYLIPSSNDDIRQEQFRELVAEGVLPIDYDKEEYYNRQPQPPPPHPPKRHPPPAAPPASVHHRSRSPSRVVMQPKQKVMSILDRARTAMEGYPPHSGYSDHEGDYDYGRAYHPESEHHHPPSTSRPRAAPIDYRRDYYYRETTPDPPFVKHSSSEHPHHHRSSSSSWRSAAPTYPGEEHYSAAPRLRAPQHHSYPERSYRGSPYMRPK